jgi:superfamily II DNA or RNA helicase
MLFNMKFTLREDQVKVVSEVLTLLQTPNAHPLVQLCVGGGKTSAIASTLIDEHFTLQDNEIVVFLVHTEVLARQAYETFKKTLHNLNYEVGIIGGAKLKKFQNFKAKVQVAMKDTFKNNLPRFKNEYKWVVKYALVDEMHNCGAKQYRNLLEDLIKNDNTRCIGLSATPERRDTQATYPFRPEWTVIGLQNKDAIALKVNAPYRLYAPQVYDSKNAKMKGEDFDLQAMSDSEQKKGDTSVLFNPDIKKAFTLLPKDIKIKGLVFCIDTKHILTILSLLENNGYRASAITGAMNADQKDIVLEKLKNGDIDFLVTCNVLNEGFDLPEVNVLICLRPTTTPRIFLQQYGRGARYIEGKINHIFDFAGNHQTIGLPDEERAFSVRTLLLKYKKGGGGGGGCGLMVCGKCYVVIPIIELTCPHCGFLNVAKEQKYSAEEVVLVKESLSQKLEDARNALTQTISDSIELDKQQISIIEQLEELINTNAPKRTECMQICSSIATPEFFKQCFTETLNKYIKDISKQSLAIDILKQTQSESGGYYNRMDYERPLIAHCIACLENDIDNIKPVFKNGYAYILPIEMVFTSINPDDYKTMIRSYVDKAFKIRMELAKHIYECFIENKKTQIKQTQVIMLKNNQTGEITMLDDNDADCYFYNPFVVRITNHQVFLYDLTDGREVRIKIDNDIIEPSQIKAPAAGDCYTIKKYKQYQIPPREFGTWIATTGFSYVDNSEYSVVVKNQ